MAAEAGGGGGGVGSETGGVKRRLHRADDEHQGENEEDMFPVTRRRGGRNYRGGKKVTSTSPWMIGVVSLLGISVFLLLLLALGIVSLPIGSDAPKIQTVDHHFVDEHKKSFIENGDVRKREDQWTEVLSWEPRAYIYHNFLSKRECEYLIELATPHMVKSTVVDSETGKSKDSRVRTSSGTFLQRGQDKIVRTIEKRIADFTFIPVEHGEGLQVLHYQAGQKYEPHFDYFNDEFNTKNGGQRIATVLMYLSDVEEGGETVFPSAKVNISSLPPYYDQLSQCGKNGLAARPKMGDALLFWSMKPDASLDPLSLHAGCPVIKGNKWSSTKWLRMNEYKVY